MKCQKINGFSLIEMLISMVIAAVVIIGIYSFLTSSQRSFTLVQANDGMNRTMQMTNRNVTDFIRMAGFRNYRRVIESVTFPKESYNLEDGEAHFAYNAFYYSPKTGSGAAGSQNHEIYLRYYGSSIDDDQNFAVTNLKSNKRMFDCNGDYLTREDLAVIHLYVDEDEGLICDQVIIHETAAGTTSSDQSRVVINPNVRNIMFAFRSDENSEFKLPYEMDYSSSNEALNYATVNGVRYGFITKQETHQKVTTVTADLTYHMLGMDSSADGNDKSNVDKVVIPQTQDSTHDIYNLTSGVIYARNRFYEVD